MALPWDERPLRALRLAAYRDVRTPDIAKLAREEELVEESRTTRIGSLEAGAESEVARVRAGPVTGSHDDAVVAEGLVKHYKDVTAVDGVSLTVPFGRVLGVLGPNGAGKTTTVRILTTLIRPDAGHASVAGKDVIKDPGAVRRLIGVSGQYAAVDEYLTGFENLEMVGRLYTCPEPTPGLGRESCSPSSDSRTQPTDRPRATRAACADASTSPGRSSPARR